MKTSLSLLTLGVALAVLYGTPRDAMAEETSLLPGETEGFEQLASPVWFGASVMDEAALAEQRGGTELELQEIHAVGSVSKVTATDLVTGHNLVTEGSLAGASGIPMLIQNSGNGVLIQNAVIVKVDVH